jgi:hypothetical protein
MEWDGVPSTWRIPATGDIMPKVTSHGGAPISALRQLVENANKVSRRNWLIAAAASIAGAGSPWWRASMTGPPAICAPGHSLATVRMAGRCLKQWQAGCRSSISGQPGASPPEDPGQFQVEKKYNAVFQIIGIATDNADKVKQFAKNSSIHSDGGL